MKTSKQQSSAFRRALHAEKAREAYRTAREFQSLVFDEWEPEDLSKHAPVPTLGAWWEMEVQL